MKTKKECTVCQKENSSYKCPKCLAAYCSAGCCAHHKLSCPALTTTQIHAETEELNTTPVQVQTQAGSVANAGDASAQPTQPEISAPSSSSEIVILQADEKNNILNSKALPSILRSKRLRDDISCIDSSSDRQSALKAMRAKNPEFNQFVDLLLKNVK